MMNNPMRPLNGDEWLEQPDADVRAGLTELVRKAASAQSAGFGSKSTYDGELTTGTAPPFLH
eukprot:COSAG06_NODE_919_length_11549_cov_28.666114_1_plen_62_part_00